MKVLIMRGISGAGKTTWIEKNHPEAVVASADSVFLTESGNYAWSAEELHNAHKQAYQTYIQAVLNNEPLVIIDNTNIPVWQISPYVMPSQSFGYEVEIVTIECDPELAIQRKQWVPADKVRRMATLLVSEERRFPSFMQRIHRKLTQGDL